MGCLVALECEAVDEPTALAAIAAAWQAIGRVVRLMDPAAPASDLARLNTARVGEVLRLDGWSTQLLRLSRRLCAATEGWFDPALPGSGSVRTLADLGGNRWRVRERLQLDLGGIAKGFAVDRAIHALRARGARTGLVNAGGDLRLFCRRPRMLWLRRSDGALLPLSMHSGALAVSDPGALGRPPAHRGYYRGDGASPAAENGAPPATAGAPRAVATIAQDCARADAMTKVFLQADAPLAQRLAKRVGVRFLELQAAPAVQPGRTWPLPRSTYL
jgi:thiamine biosynthesis lipoprotein